LRRLVSESTRTKPHIQERCQAPPDAAQRRRKMCERVDGASRGRGGQARRCNGQAAYVGVAAEKYFPQGGKGTGPCPRYFLRLRPTSPHPATTADESA